MPDRQHYLTSRTTGRPAVLKEAVVNGAAANTDIAVAGIKPADIIVGVLEYAAPAVATGKAVTDRTAQTSITSAGNIQVTAATNANADNVLVVKYYSV